MNKSDFPLSVVSPAQVSPHNVNVFEGIVPQSSGYVHAGPREVAEVAVPSGEEHLFCYDKGLHVSQCTDFILFPAPDFSWSDWAAGTDLGQWSSQASLARA